MNNSKEIKAEDIDIAIRMMTTHINVDEIKDLLSALETLKNEPANQGYHDKVIEAFNGLGILQGAGLTYAPYMNVFVSSDPFGD